MRIHSNHFTNYEAAEEAGRRNGVTSEALFGYRTGDFYIGRPPEKNNLTIVETEQGEFLYITKPRQVKGQIINEVV